MKTSNLLELVLCMLPLAGAAMAQQTAQASPPPAKAAPLPLSGRAPQAGAVTATQAVQPGTGVNTLQPSLQASGAYAGSAPAPAPPFNGRLSLSEAIGRGLAYNLGAEQWANTVRQAEGQSRSARAALLPNLSGSLDATVQQVDLKALGFKFTPPPALAAAGFNFPTIVGPFSYMELEASLEQAVLDTSALNNYRASQQNLRANRLQQRDARDLVVLGVGGAYLGVIAAQARLDSSRAQLETANAILAQSQQKQSVGALAQLTVDQNAVQAAVQQLQLTSLTNDLAKQKINLARMIGLPADAPFTLSDALPFAPPPPLTLAAALQRALEQRADLQAAAAQAEAARAAAAAARDERMPSVAVSGSYGVIGVTPWESSHGVFSVVGSLRIPLWEGGRASGDIEQADAALTQRQAEVADTRGQIEAQVREAFLDVGAAADQVTVARNNQRVAHEALEMTQERFQAGVINTVELVQAQQAVVTADEDFINSVYAHNLAKLTLARALGGASSSWPQYLPVAVAPPAPEK